MKKIDAKTSSKKKSSEHDVSTSEIPTYSSAIVQLLKKYGYKQTEIAKYVGKEPSFIAHVKRNRLSFTVTDLEKIEQGTSMPIFWLLMEAAHEAKIPRRLKKAYDAGRMFFTYTTMAKIVGKNVLKE